MLLLLPLVLPSWQHASASLRERPAPQRAAPALSRRHALTAAAAAALGGLPGARPTSAAYGEFARMSTDASTQGVLAAGDSNNECLFATPGTGLCQVYKSSEPALWDSPNLQGAKAKLLKAATALADLEIDITKARWTAVLQALGASRDLREAVGFLTKAAHTLTLPRNSAPNRAPNPAPNNAPKP